MASLPRVDFSDISEFEAAAPQTFEQPLRSKRIHKITSKEKRENFDISEIRRIVISVGVQCCSRLSFSKVRSHIAVDLQQTNIRPVTLVEDMINRNIKLDREPLWKRMPVS